MSASREKKNRQELANSGWVDPKVVKEAEQRKKEKRSNAVYGIIAAIFVIVIAVALVWRSNIIQKNSTAVTVDGSKFTSVETNFYYQNVFSSFYNNNYYLLSYLGFDPSTPAQNQTLNSTAAAMLDAEEGMTWHAYFLQETASEIATLQNGLKAAEAEGYVYPESVQAEYEDVMSQLKTAAANSNVSTDEYLTNMLGANMTEKVYGEHLLKTIQFETYMSSRHDALSYTDAELEERYAADPSSYDKVSYEYVFINGTPEETKDADGNTVAPTEEEEAAAMAVAKDAADAILADLKSGKTLKDLAGDFSYSSSESASHTGDIVTDWLFDEARSEEDSAILEGTNGYYVVLFHERYRETYDTVNVRHILIQPEAGKLASGTEGYEAEQSELKAAAKAKAEDILAQWKSGEATEDSFAQLAKEYSSDGSKYVGGLYTRVYQGQMVSEFNDWIFDASRNVGDVDIVETTYGYHVMFFSGTDLPRWQAVVSDELASEEVTAYYESLSADSKIEQSSFGMQFVG